ncbi:hypothetical protein QR680_017166 [Steinernema hermaphroditum]|uniref:Uncharacterized protein n=1 Tax=Steinernema hermaphroditum TaxID=289476 RepID=A0AA39LNS0_9BILA|nr:hypothetical protein QR680_017166 [Steinernema hermaphroditum]
MEAEGSLEETSQLWVLRHLRLVLGDVDDRLLTRFVFEEDCTPLRNFVSHFTDSPALFLVVERRTESFQKPPPVEREKPKPRKRRETRAKAPVKKTMKPQAKRRTRKSESEEWKKGRPQKPEELPVVVAEELKLIEKGLSSTTLEEAELHMEWRLGSLPRTDEFLFFLTRSTPKETERSEFDQAFYVGYCASGGRLGSLLENAKFLLGERVSFEREFQIFHYFVGVVNCGGVERGENEFDDFLYESIGRTHAPPARVSMTVLGQVTTIEEILKPRVEDFMKNADEDSKSRLLLELSFFEVKQLAEDDEVRSLCRRVDRVRDALEVYAAFFLDANRDFFRKLYPYAVENCFKIVAENIRRKCDYLEADFFEEVADDVEKMRISREIMPRILRILELEGHEFPLLAKTKQNFKLLEEIKRLVGKMRSPRFDDLWDRTLIEKSTKEVDALVNTLKENCIESMLESANFEALRFFCLQIDAHRLSLQSIRDQLP